MDAQERIDNILVLAVSRMQEEVSGLLGADFLLIGDRRSFIGKEAFFEQAAGKQVVAKMGLTGELEGAGCLMVNISDSIRLGGTLIMLPSSELEEFVGREDYSEDVADAFGEIANILCGALTKVFEENYPKACRLVRQQQTVIKPAKVDIASAEPFPDQPYYQLRAAMSLAGVAMGDLFILLPPEPFGLKAPASVQAAAPQAEVAQGDVPKESQEKAGASEIPAVAATPPPAASATIDATPDPSQDAEEWQDSKDHFDTSLTDASQTLQVEFTSLLGTDVQLGTPENRLITKDEFFREECAGPQLLADMEMAGDVNGLSYLFCPLPDAIHLGGTLIMLPPSELEVVVAENDLTPDVQDAYGEIANIIAGVYGGIFEERGKKKFRLIKRDLRQLLSLDVEVASDAPIPDVLYYQSSVDLSVDGKELGKLRLLVPADLIGLRPPVTIATQPETSQRQAIPGPQAQSAGIPSAPLAAQRADGAIEALVIGDDEAEAERVAAVIAQTGVTAKKIGFKDNLYSWLPGQVRVVFLVMREIDERAFGIAIKVGAVCPLPLVAVAPGWTRSRVIKAARYGVSDILSSPASETMIGESLRHSLVKR